MIDMTFLLLVFFMVTSVLTEQKTNKDIDLPEATASIAPKNHTLREVINIDKKGNYSLSNKTVTKEDLSAYLKKRFGVTTPYVVYLRADKNMHAEKIGEFMEIATEARVEKVIFGVLND